jgi:hypothetical protein
MAIPRRDIKLLTMAHATMKKKWTAMASYFSKFAVHSVHKK